MEKHKNYYRLVPQPKIQTTVNFYNSKKETSLLYFHLMDPIVSNLFI